MDQNELIAWSGKSGWQILAGCPSLTKPSSPKEAIVRIVLKATVASLEVKKPAGKWEKIASAKYGDMTLPDDAEWPLGLGFEKIPSFAMLMRENKDRQVFAKFGR